MGKKDVTTTERMDPAAEKFRNIGYNATLERLGMGGMGGYTQGGQPYTPEAPKEGGRGFLFGLGGPFGPPISPTNPFSGPGGTAPAPDVSGVQQFTGGPTYSMAGPNIGPGMPGGNPWEQDYQTAGTDVAGYDPGMTDAYGGTQSVADRNAAMQGQGYDAAGRFLDPAQAAADAQARMNPWMTGVDQAMTAKFEEALAKAQAAAKGNAIAQGAFGSGSRMGVAAGEATRGSMLDFMDQQARMRNEAYYNAQGQTERAAGLGANLGLGAGGQALEGYGQQGQFADQFRQLQQDKYDTPFRDLSILQGMVTGAPFTRTTKESGGGGFF